MKLIKIRQTVLGDGRVKICLPVVGTTRSDVEEQLMNALKYEPDLIEFRADWYEHVFEKVKLKSILEYMRSMAGEVPILFTFRSKSEGGERSITWENYKELLLFVSEQGFVDAVDVEAFFNYEAIIQNSLASEVTEESIVRMKNYQDHELTDLVEELKKNNCVVIGSNHDFEKTPSVAQMEARLEKMHQFGMDVSKLAVMPKNPEDVIALNQATYSVWNRSRYSIVLITMSMGILGVSSRLCGGIYGNSLSFAAAGKSSAPGQVEVELLRNILSITQ